MAKEDYIKPGDMSERMLFLAVQNERERIEGIIFAMLLYDAKCIEAVRADRFKILTLIRMGVEPESEEMRKICTIPKE